MILFFDGHKNNAFLVGYTNEFHNILDSRVIKNNYK